MARDQWRREIETHPVDIRRDVDAEMEFHLETLVERHVRAGVPYEEARRMARKQFGNRKDATDACVDIDRARLDRRRRTLWFQDFRSDLVHGARRLVASPGFSSLTVLTLALGIGPAVAIFTIL